MRTDISRSEWSVQEHWVRETLQAHAPTIVDTDSGWQAVASRLTATRQAEGRLSGRARTTVRRVGARVLATPRRFALVASLIAAVVVLGGAGVGAAYWGGFLGGSKAQLIGDASLYTAVDQSQTVDSISLTIDAAYADPGNMYLAISIRMPRDLAQRYDTITLNHITVTDASGAEANGLFAECSSLTLGLFSDVGTEHCMLNVSPFLPTQGATHLMLTVEIGEVWLLRRGDATPDVRNGPWRFQFTFPFHTKALGPGGPYTQPNPGS